MRKKLIEHTLDGKEVITLSARQYNKWEKEHLEELLPRWELEQMRKFDEQRKRLPLIKRFSMEIKERFRAIVGRFYLIRKGNGRARK